MIKVYFESSSHAELIATFETEELYMTCLPALEAKAKEARMKVTEAIEDDIEHAKEVLRHEGYYVNNLWHIRDVQNKYKCSDNKAIEVLETAIEMQMINESITHVCQDLNMEENNG